MFRIRLDDGSIEEDVLRKILELHSHPKPNASLQKIRKDLDSWSKVDHRLRIPLMLNWCVRLMAVPLNQSQLRLSHGLLIAPLILHETAWRRTLA